MKIVPASAYLSEFDSGASIEFEISDLPEMLETPLLPTTPEKDLNGERDEIFKAGIKEGKKLAEEGHVLQLEEQTSQLTEQFNQEISNLRDNIARQLASQLEVEMENLNTEISNLVAATLRPFVTETINIRIIDELKAAIVDVLNDPQACQIIACGPAVMLNRLTKCLDETGASIQYIETNDPEITIDIGQEKIESRIQAWSKLMNREIG